MSDWEKKEAVKEVLNAWSYHAGRFDADAMGTLFTEDAEIHGVVEMVGGVGPLKGGPGVVEMMKQAFPNFVWLTQMNTIVKVELDAAGTTATTRLNLVERAGMKDHKITFHMVAVYDDVLKLTDKGWKIQRRQLTAYDVRQLPQQEAGG